MECVECGRDNHICYATTRPQEREHARDDAIVRVTLHTDTSHEKLAALSVSQFLPSRNIFLGHANVRKDVNHRQDSCSRMFNARVARSRYRRSPLNAPNVVRDTAVRIPLRHAYLKQASK